MEKHSHNEGLCKYGMKMDTRLKGDRGNVARMDV